MSLERRDVVWQDPALVRTFLTGVRGGLPLAAEQIDVMLRLANALERDVERFLDLGCGDGVLTEALLTRFPDAHATVVDFSEPMLAEAVARFATWKNPPELLLADLSDPGWTSAAAGRDPFDLVVSGFAIHHLPDARKAALYAEIFALLTPGGFFVNIEHVSSPTAWIGQMFDSLLIDALFAYHQRGGGAMSREEVAAAHVHRPDKAANILLPVETQCAWLRDIGFTDVDCYCKIFELAVFGGRRPN